MECKKAYDLIHEVIDGTARGSDRVAVKRHVARCDRCAEKFHAQRSLMGYLNKLDVEEVPAGFGERVIGYLKSTGRIVETVSAHEPERGALGRIFDWLPASFRVPIVMEAKRDVRFGEMAELPPPITITFLPGLEWSPRFTRRRKTMQSRNPSIVGCLLSGFCNNSFYVLAFFCNYLFNVSWVDATIKN